MTIEERIEAMSGKTYMGYVARLQCVCCEIMGVSRADDHAPVQVHHPRKHGGRRELTDKQTIPLCPFHHDQDEQSIHRARRRVEEIYGVTEEQMSAMTREKVKALMVRDVSYATAIA
ncbi:MAG: Ref family recombination enhancement nuclease [Casimicrobium sp.]